MAPGRGGGGGEGKEMDGVSDPCWKLGRASVKRSSSGTTLSIAQSQPRPASYVWKVRPELQQRPLRRF